jgi:hypothetical protein
MYFCFGLSKLKSQQILFSIFLLFTEPVYGIKPFPTPDDSLYHFIPSKQYGEQHPDEQYD